MTNLILQCYELSGDDRLEAEIHGIDLRLCVVKWRAIQWQLSLGLGIAIWSMNGRSVARKIPAAAH